MCDNNHYVAAEEVERRDVAAVRRHLLAPEAVAAAVDAYRNERTKLEAAIRDAQNVMAARGGVAAADPVVEAIVSYAGALGRELEAAKLSPWLTLLAVVFFEVGAAASLIVVAALSDVAVVEKPASAPAARGRKRAKPLDDVMDKLKEAGGQLEGALDEIGGRLGLSRSSAHRALHALGGLGAVSLATSAAGTVVQRL